MPCSAVILGWVAGWAIDRLYEAGVEDGLQLLPLLPPLAVPQAGALLGAGVCAAASLALLAQRSLLPLRAIQAHVVKEGSRGRLVSGAQRSRARRAIAALKRDILAQQRWGVAIEGGRDLVEWASYSAAYLLSGNLLAPFAAAAASDLAFTLWQRARLGELEAGQGSVARRLADLRELLLIARARAELRIRRRERQRARGGKAGSGGPADGGSSSDGESDA